jgi:hypothetical protein
MGTFAIDLLTGNQYLFNGNFTNSGMTTFSGITSVNNGLSMVTSRQAKLGGVLNCSTILTRGAGNTAGVEYGGNYSASFSNRSLVDKGYVDNKVSGSTVWGHITGTLSGQTDLQQVLNDKLDVAIPITYNDLIVLMNTSGLTKAQFYIITDFQTKHNIFDGTTVLPVVHSGGYNNYQQNNDFVTAAWDFYMTNGFMQPAMYIDGAKGMWFTQTQNNIYGLLHSGNTINFNGISGDRTVYNLSTLNFENSNGEKMTVVDSIFVGLQFGGSFQVFGRQIYDYQYYDNYSYIKIYKLVGKNSLNQNIIALLIKPVGQDIFRLNYVPNIGNLDLYAIYYEGDNDHQPFIKRLTNADRHNDIVGDISFTINKTDWCIEPQTASSGIRKHIGRDRMKKFRFFFGDAYGNISSFSPEITPIIFENDAKMMTLISKI